MNKPIKFYTKDAFQALINMSESDIRQLSKNYDELKGIYLEGNPVSFLHGGFIPEGMIRTLGAEATVRYVKDFFSIPDRGIVIFKLGEDEFGNTKSFKKEVRKGEFVAEEGFNKSNYDETISILICNIKNNVKSIENAMNLCGYFLASPRLDDVPPNGWAWYKFEKRNQNSYSKKLREETDCLYHVTPVEHVKSILKIGFSPKSKNEFFSYPERIFFFSGANGKEKALKYAANLLQSVIKKEYEKELELKRTNGREKNPYSHSHDLKKRFALITVNLHKVPEGVDFYTDSNAYGGVYTKDNLYPQVISDIEIFELDVLSNRITYKGKFEDEAQK